MTVKEFLKWEKESQDTIDVKRCYIDVAGEFAAGVVLSQIVYWNLPDKQGNPTKLRVTINGKDWLAKRREDWWNECRVKPKQLDRCLADLERKGLIQTRVWKFAGNPTKHVWLDVPALVSALNGCNNVTPPEGESFFPNEEEPNSSTGNIDTPERGISYNKDDFHRLRTENKNIDYVQGLQRGVNTPLEPEQESGCAADFSSKNLLNIDPKEDCPPEHGMMIEPLAERLFKTFGIATTERRWKKNLTELFRLWPDINDEAVEEWFRRYGNKTLPKPVKYFCDTILTVKEDLDGPEYSILPDHVVHMKKEFDSMARESLRWFPAQERVLIKLMQQYKYDLLLDAWLVHWRSVEGTKAKNWAVQNYLNNIEDLLVQADRINKLHEHADVNDEDDVKTEDDKDSNDANE